MKTAATVRTRSGLESGFNFAAWSNVAWCFVLADVETASRGLKEETRAKRWQKNAAGKTLEVEGPYFHPFRVTGNAWTNLVGFFDSTETGLSPELMARISRRLKTRALFAIYQDTSGIFMYLLYENGRLLEMLHWDGSDAKPRILRDLGKLKVGSDVAPPYGFCFASKLRKLKPGVLTAGKVESFFDDFLRSHGVFLVFEAAVGSQGKIVFRPSRLKAREIERVDFVGLLDEKQALASRQQREEARKPDEIMEESNKAYFWAYLAREEYKDMRSQRPTRAQALKHAARFKRHLAQVRVVLQSAANPNPLWLYRAALNGNLPVVELLLTAESYPKRKTDLDEALRAARENGRQAVAEKLMAAGATGNKRTELEEVVDKLKGQLPPELLKLALADS